MNPNHDPLTVLSDHSSGRLIVSWYPWAKDERPRAVLTANGGPPVFVAFDATLPSFQQAIGALRFAQRRDAAIYAVALRRLSALVLSMPVIPEMSRLLDGSLAGDRAPDTIDSWLEKHGGMPLWIVPHNLFHEVPWAALSRSDGRHLIEDRTVAIAPSMSLLKRPEPAREHPRALVIGNPDLSLKEAFREGVSVAGTLRDRGWTVDLRARDPDRPEDARIGPEEFLRIAPEYDLIHLSTHGDFITPEPAAIGKIAGEKSVFDSYLKLSPAQGSSLAREEPSANESGHLLLKDVLGLKLRSQAVVLSTCVSSAADLDRNYDPVSLATAFLARGAGVVIGAQREVSDRATRVLMEDMYRGVLQSGKTWPLALREAQLKMLRQGMNGALDSKRGEGELPKGRWGPSMSQAKVAAGRLEQDLMPEWKSPLYWGAFQAFIGQTDS